MIFREASERIAVRLREAVPKEWDGRRSILEMRDSGSKYWKQMEWIGFYFQFLCEKHLRDVMDLPGPRYGNVQFDGTLGIPWDFKAHAINTSSHQLIVNDRIAIESAIVEHGAVGIVLALGKVVYNDDKRRFQAWHNKIKGGRSEYEVERIRRGAWSRLRKTHFSLQQISLVKLDRKTLAECGAFQIAFRNADGSPRKAKALIDLERINESTVHFVEF